MVDEYSTDPRNARSTTDYLDPGLSGLTQGNFSLFADPFGFFTSGARVAAAYAANAENRAIAEQGRQFDITQEQYAPYREAGLRGLSQYEQMLGQYGDYNIPSNLPGAYNPQTQVPDLYGVNTGNYAVQSNVPQAFTFGQEQFDQYKSPGYEFNTEQELQALDRKLAAQGKRRSGQRVRSLTEMGQSLAANEYQNARERAYQDYLSGVSNEANAYQRSVDQYGRNVSREQTLNDYARNQYLSDAQREAMLYDMGYQDYTSQVQREADTYNRALQDYARLYVDPMSNYGAIAGTGQSTTTGLASLRENYANSVSQGMNNIGNLNSAARIAQANNYSNILGAAGQWAGSYFNSPTAPYNNYSGISGVSRGSQQDQMLADQWS